MQIHELNTFGGGTPGEMDFLALDTGFDTTKISAPDLLKPVRDQADDLGAKKVDLPLDEHNDPSYGTAGQLLRTKGDGSTEWVDEGLPTDEQTEAAINKWLDDHPEATTTVADGSLTEAKFSAALKLKTLKDYVTPEMFGAVGDGLTDDTAAWNAAIASGKPIVAVNDYLTTSQLSLDNDVYMLGTIYNDVSSAVKISGKGSKTYILKVAAKAQNSSQFIGVDVEDTNNCQFEIKSVNFYIGVRFRGYGTGCAYNCVENIFVANSKYFLLLQAENAGWCNENYFYNGRFLGETGTLYKGADYGITLELVSGNHILNSNHFQNFCAEGSYCAVNVLNGRENSFNHFRTEGCTYNSMFAVGTLWNVLFISYGLDSNIDNGTNAVIFMSEQVKDKINVLVASSGSLAGISASNGTSVTAPRIYNVWHTSNVLPSIYNGVANALGISRKGQLKMGFLVNVENNRALKLSIHVTGDHRCAVVPFDENNEFVEDATIKVGDSSMSKAENSIIGKYYIEGVNVSGSREIIVKMSENVKTAFIGVVLMSDDSILHRLDLYGKTSNFEVGYSPLPILSSVPTSDGYYINQEVYKNDGSVKWVWNGSSWTQKSI